MKLNPIVVSSNKEILDNFEEEAKLALQLFYLTVKVESYLLNLKKALKRRMEKGLAQRARTCENFSGKEPKEVYITS